MIFRKIKKKLESVLVSPENHGKSITAKGHKIPVKHPIFFSRPQETFAVGYNPEEFKQLTGLTYIPQLEFENYHTLARIKKQCAHALKTGAITQEMKWLGTLHAKEIRSGFVNDVTIAWIDDNIGYGVFARKDIEQGEYIGEYTGVVKRCHLIFRNVNEYCFHYPIYNLFINVHTIDAQYKGNETRFINHKNQANCASFICYTDNLLHVCIRAQQPISKDSELTYHYGKDWWGDRRCETQTI